MKKVFHIIVAFFLMVGIAYCADLSVVKSPTVMWTQDTASLESITRWEFAMGDTETGPWNVALNLPKPDGLDLNQGEIEFSNVYEITITGAIGSTVKKYFVIRAVAPETDPNTPDTEAFSDWSDLGIVVDPETGAETNYMSIKIVPGKPFQFKLTIKSGPGGN